ncbi:unnamed protein product [Nyctereutes procyonoides]|uniref:Cyclin-dependent kinases regulatory subunit n=1 Tax=Nyctereutes procyonoides TaxID=34880 RepID=A0A811YMW2_NYCPR|nr:unnamed protein product [Nyctereutes procyonoides]
MVMYFWVHYSFLSYTLYSIFMVQEYLDVILFYFLYMDQTSTETHLMSEEEQRRLGVQQSLGWVHYMIHEPEPHILLFRRPLPKEQQK